MYNGLKNNNPGYISKLVNAYRDSYIAWKNQKNYQNYGTSSTIAITKTMMLKYAKNNDETRYLKYLMGMIADDGSMAAVKNRIGSQRVGYLSGLVNKYGLAGTYSSSANGELSQDYINT